MPPARNGRSLATLEELLARLERLEMVTGILATLAARQQLLDSQTIGLLSRYATAVSTERAERDTSAHLPEPDL